MNKRLERPCILFALLALYATQQGISSAHAATLRFVAEFSTTDNTPASPSSLKITFYDSQPGSQQAEDVLRKCLEAAISVHLSSDITASAWFSATGNDADKQPVTLASGSNSLSYNANDQTINVGAGSPTGALNKSGETQEDNQLAAIAKAPKVMDACKDVEPPQLATLVNMGATKRGSERKFIVKAMRTWCKENGIELDRKMRSCMSAISKAIVAADGAAGMNPEDLTAAVARGVSAYNVGQCSKCHGSNGRGSSKGPDLTDSTWVHCDGSMSGIRKILISGVPQNKIKDSSLPFGMNPATNLIPDQKQITDLAAYVQSLSKS